jgi:hypothetical protein
VGKSFCPLGVAAAWPIQRAIKKFPDDFKKWLHEITYIYATNVCLAQCALLIAFIVRGRRDESRTLN